MVTLTLNLNFKFLKLNLIISNEITFLEMQKTEIKFKVNVHHTFIDKTFCIISYFFNTLHVSVTLFNNKSSEF